MDNTVKDEAGGAQQAPGEGPDNPNPISDNEVRTAIIQRTLVLLKPDAIERGLAGQIIGRLESRGLRVVQAYCSILTPHLVDDHYHHVKDRDFYPAMRDFFLSGPSMRLVMENHAWAQPAVPFVRGLIGPTDHHCAAAHTIRGWFSEGRALMDPTVPVYRNLVHASESLEDADVEIRRFFPGHPALLNSFSPGA